LVIQLTDLLEAGCSLRRALEAIARQAATKPLSRLAETLKIEIENGTSLAGAMEKLPGLFSHVDVAMIRAAERGGFLPKTLSSLARRASQSTETRKQIRAKLAYPTVLAVAVIASTIFLMTYVVPKFAQIYQSTQQALPGPTKTLLAVCGVVQRHGMYLAALLILVVLMVRGLLRFKSLRIQWDALVLRLPIVGPTLRDWQIYNFAGTMSLLLSGGVTALRGLRLAAGVVANRHVRAEIEILADAVEHGEPLSGPMRDSTLFDATTVEMIVVSEASGNLAAVLGRLAAQRYRDFQMRIGVMLSLLEPVIILVMAIVVALIVMALLLPVFSMNSLVS